MRKFIVVLTVLLIVVLSYLGYAHFSGGAVPTFGLPIGGEKAQIRAVTLAFFEHVKFKNASAFKEFVALGTDPAVVDAYLDKTLGQDTEKIDLIAVEIKSIELDSKQTRARVHVGFMGQDLALHKPVDLEKIVFLYRADDRWFIDINSLSP